MPKYLVIIESPGKIKKLKQLLGPEYNIKASYGHVLDLPKKKLGVDIRKGFEPTFEVLEDKQSVLDDFIRTAKKSDMTYIFTDQDREGCAIGWNIFQKLPSGTKVKRIKSDSITREGVQAALANATDIEADLPMVHAQLTRRMLDRLAGYKTSFLTFQATGGRSAGRVQSAILRLITERELEIRNFKPEEYWVITATFLTKRGAAYHGALLTKKRISDEKTATTIYDKVMKGNPAVFSIERKEVASNPFPPFTTASMVQSASSLLNWNAKRTMQVAQTLYEMGSITYHRSDSTSMATEAVDAIRSMVSTQYRGAYLPNTPRVYTAKSGAQEAHECVRPTQFESYPDLNGDEARLYDLIWRRAVSSQMTPGRDQRTKVLTRVAEYDFVSTGVVTLFDGYRRVWTFGRDEDVLLPELSEGEKVDLKSLSKEQKFTEPPPRFSDGSLNKQCEKEQIARPATFANFIETLKSRGYITQKGKSLQATDLGISVVDFLKKSDMCFVDIKFTASMEKLLDDIQEEKKQLTDVMSEFWQRLKADIERGKSIRNAQSVTEYKCPKCGGTLLQKHSRFGAFYSCSNYKATKKITKTSTKKTAKKVVAEGCDFTAKIGSNGQPVEKAAAAPKEYAPFRCKKCGAQMVKRQSKKGDPFYGCENFFKTGCKCTASIEGEFSIPKTKKRKSR